MAGLIRRLGNFTKPLPAAITIHQNHITLKPFSTEASTRDIRLQKMVDRFKKSCDNSKFRGSKAVFSSHVRRLSAAKKFSMIEDILEHQKSYKDIRSEGFANRLIALYGEAGMFDHARNLFDELPALECPRTVKSFNALLKAGVDAKAFDRVVEAFADLPPTASVKPDLTSHNILILAMCEMGSIDGALSTLRSMDGPDLVTFNTLLNALYKSRRFAEGESLWAQMESESKVTPNVRSYNARLRGMFSESRVQEAVGLVSKMKRDRIEPDEFTYDALIKGFCGNGDLKEALKCYNDLQGKKLTPNLVGSYLTLIPACCEAGNLDKAFELCSDAVGHKLTPNAVVFKMFKRVIDGLTKVGRTEEALKLKNLINPAE